MIRRLVVSSLALALAALALPVQRAFVGSAEHSVHAATVERPGDIPDLVVVGERASRVTTVYTQFRDGQWGDIPDQIVIGKAPAGFTAIAAEEGQWGDIPDLIVTGSAPSGAAQAVAAAESTGNEHRL